MSTRPRSRRSSIATLAACIVLGFPTLAGAQINAVTLEGVMAFPFPSDLVAAPAGQRIAWAAVQNGVRNVFVADGPQFTARPLTTATEEDGQELTNLAFSADGRWLVWTRGGDHGSNWPAEGNLQPNPTSRPIEPRVQIWAADLVTEAAAPRVIADGDLPVPSPRGDVVVFQRGRDLWMANLVGEPSPRRLLFARGESHDPVWSPDGSQLAFVSDRGSHSYVAVFRSEREPLQYLAPTAARDGMPRWSPDGRRIAFVRQPGRGGPPSPPLDPQPSPWAIWIADLGSGDARAVWTSDTSARGSYPRVNGGANLCWAADGRLVFLSYQDGWPHLYSLARDGGAPLLLTPGDFMVEHVALAPDGRSLVYSANTGSEAHDIERRHLFKVAVDRPEPVALTSGAGLEWAPAITGDGSTLAYIASDARRPGLVHVKPLAGGASRSVASEAIPPDFPSAALIVPEHVTFPAPDGTTVHAQLFKPDRAPGPRPGVVFVHGGPPRQMLLGWHYMFYYANTYAVNQYLASRGFVVLSVNYRLGIGYGHDFHFPRGAGGRGASEYQDVLAAGKYLQSLPGVDPARVGIWGGSYGGFLTALALGRNSDVFAAGVDLHGVHARATAPDTRVEVAAAVGDGLTPAQLDEATRIAWESSPVAWVKTWRSPVLLVHGDDDRNVRVEQTVDLVQRLRAANVPHETIIIPDDVHDFLLQRNWLRVARATAEFLERHLQTADRSSPAGPPAGH